jgi:hypothetical protein
MNRVVLPVLLTFAVACSSTVSGTLVDGLSGQPIAGRAVEAGKESEAFRIVARASKKNEQGKWEPNLQAGLTCQTFSATIGTDGKFTMPNLCTSATDYKIEVADNKDVNYFLGEIDAFEKGMDAAAPVTLKAWRAPMGTALNVLDPSANSLTPVKTRQNVRKETIKDTASEIVYYPESIPGGIPLVAEGQYLVVTGAQYADWTLHPLINNGPLEFKVEEGMESGPKMDAWSYVGTQFTDNSTFTRVTAQIDESKVVKVEKGGHIARFIPAGAVSPPGRFLVWKEGEAAGFVVDIGVAGTAPVAAPAPEAPPQ